MRKSAIVCCLLSVLAAWAALAPGLTSSSAPASSQAASVPAAAARIVIAHINDVHGQTQGEDGEGGYARLATALEQVRADKTATRVFFVHAGDELSRGDDLTRLSRGRANFEVLNYLKLDAFVPGNGDYYEDARNLAALMRFSRFPWLTSNVFTASGETLGKPELIESAGDVRVGFFGLCFLKADSDRVHGVRVQSPSERAKELVPDIRKRADVVVAITHIGLDQDEYLATAAPGIDVIIGGHSHTTLPKGKTITVGQRRVLIAQTGQHLANLGVVTLDLARNGAVWEVVRSEARLVSLGDKVPQDPKVKAILARCGEALSRPASEPAPAPSN